MDKFVEQITKLNEEHAKRLAAYEWGRDAVERLGLSGLLDFVTVITAHPSYMQPDKFSVQLFFSAEQKPQIMPILTVADVDDWRRQVFLARGDAFSDDGRYHDWLYTDFDCRENGHRLTIRLVSAIQEGDEVEGCAVKRIERQSSYLSLACGQKD